MSAPKPPCQRAGKPVGLMDPAFRYRKAVETDIRKTFARVRRELKQAAADAIAADQVEPAPMATVLALPTRSSGGNA